MIHSHALVDEKARIGKNVTIGPFSVIGPDVEIGDGTVLGPHVTVSGHTRIGRDNRIFQFAVLGEIPQHRKYAGEPTRLEIGDRNTIREFCTIHRGTTIDQSVTRIGNDNFLMSYVHVGHDCVLGDHITMVNNASLAGHVHVGDYVILSGFVLVHQFCRVGEHAFLGYGSGTSSDVPPFIMANGLPAKPHGINAKGLKSRGFNPAQIEALRKAYKVLYRSNMLFADAKTELAKMGNEEPVVKVLADFVNDAARSIIR
jgi:UDP-N-acetylglucosamine acyltransferase